MCLTERNSDIHEIRMYLQMTAYLATNWNQLVIIYVISADKLVI